MVCTSAAVERANSAQRLGLVHNSQNRLAQACVNALMKVTFNWRIEATAITKAEELESSSNPFTSDDEYCPSSNKCLRASRTENYFGRLIEAGLRSGFLRPQFKLSGLVFLRLMKASLEFSQRDHG